MRFLQNFWRICIKKKLLGKKTDAGELFKIESLSRFESRMLLTSITQSGLCHHIGTSPNEQTPMSIYSAL